MCVHSLMLSLVLCVCHAFSATCDDSHAGLDKMGQQAVVHYSGLTSAYLRAAESSRPDRIIDDRFAEQLAGDEGSQLMAFVNKWGASQDDVMNLMAIRTRYLDEALNNRSKNIHQVVILASGMDARAYRLESLADCHVLELDQSSDIFERKKRILQEMQARPIAKKLDYIDSNLSDDMWDKALVAKGFDPKQPTFWCLEGLLYYLDYGSIVKVLKTINALSATGSQLWADMCGFVATEGEAIGDAPAMKFGEDNPKDGVLSLIHWDLDVEAALDQPGTHFGRDWEPVKKSAGQEGEQVVPWFFVAGKKPAANPNVEP